MSMQHPGRPVRRAVAAGRNRTRRHTRRAMRLALENIRRSRRYDPIAA